MPTEKEAIIDRLRGQRDALDPAEGEALRSEWVAALHALMEMFRGWLADAERERLLRVEAEEINRDEERLGSYQVPVMKLLTPKGESLRIVPRARIVVGARGRVDLECPPNSAILIRSEPERWQFARLVPEKRGWIFHDLSEDSFWQVIGELLLLS